MTNNSQNSAVNFTRGWGIRLGTLLLCLATVTFVGVYARSLRVSRQTPQSTGVNKRETGTAPTGKSRANRADPTAEITPFAGTLLISEFRLRGPNGANDEFIEIYNNSGAPHTVASVSGTGYGVAASDGVLRCTIPNATVIPTNGHFLCTNSVGYTYSSYPAGNGTTATGDATYATDIPDNAGIALFITNVPADFNLANRFDAVGSTSEANTLYKEGTGYPALTPFSIEYSFTRLAAGLTVTNPPFGGVPSSGLIQDTDDNAADFIFVDTNGTSAGAGQRLGAPGPKNLSAPIFNGTGTPRTLLDTCSIPGAAPNKVRDFTSVPAQNSTFGTIDLRRTYTNNTGAPLTRLRIRFQNIATFPAASGIADLRPRTSSDVVVTVDRPPCGSGTSNITVFGTDLEVDNTAPSTGQPNGGGFNSSMSPPSITLGTPLANGASIDLHFLFGIQQTGSYKIAAIAEGLPEAGDLWILQGNTEDTSDSEGAIAPPTIAKSFGAASIPLDGTTTLTFNINNPNPTGLTGLAFTDNLPAGLIVNATPNLSNTCGGTATATGGSGVITLSGGTLAGSSGCTVQVTVQGTSPGTKNNSTQITSTEGGTGNTANASIDVIAPPVIIKAFGAASVPLNGSTSLTFTIQNNNTTSGLSGVAFTDTFPAGMVVATPNGLAGSCGAGTITAVAGSGTVSLSGGTIVVNSFCTFSINVTGTTVGAKTNTTSQVTSTEGGTGGTATAFLDVEGPPTIAKAFTPAVIALNATTSLTFTITNPAANPIALTGVAFTDTLPSGLTVASASATVCGGTLTLTAPTGISLTGASIATNTQCVFSVTVTGGQIGQFTNTTGAVSSTNGGTGNTASATLVVAAPPALVKSFGVATMPVSQTTSLSFSVTNPNAGAGLTGITFTDALPPGLVVATPNALAGSCGAGTVTAVAGSGSVSLSGGSLNAGSSCTFSINVTAIAAGVQNNVTGNITATESGPGGTATATINVTLRTTSTAVSFSANPVVNGQTIQVTATVTDTDIGPKSSPAGTVNFSSAAVTDQIVPTSCSLAAVTSTTSSCTVNLSSTTINTHAVTAAYLGSAVHAPSSGNAQLTVNKANTNSVLVSSANPSVFGQPVTLTVTVTAAAPGAGIPTGTVTFLDGVNSIGTAPLVAGVGTITLSNFSVGTHPISVTYPGDGNFNGSTSNTVNQVVNKDATTTALASSVNPTEFGQNVTFTATVTANAPGAGTPTGTVTFFDGATQIGTGTLSGGVATFSTATLAVGTHPITAVYGGDGNFLTSTSSAVNQVVNKATTATTLTSSVNPSVFGQSVTFTATVVSTGPAIANPGGRVNRTVRTRTVNSSSPAVTPLGIGTPTGTVTFMDGATTIGTGTLNGSAVATFTTSALAVGTHPITAVYGGDGSFLTSTSNTVSQVVNKANTTTTVVSSANPAVFGQTVTFTATVSATAPGVGIPTGTVTFNDGVTTIGTGTLNGSGVATFSTAALAVGSHAITVSYGGDGNFNASVSAVLTQVVNKAATTTVITTSAPAIFPGGPQLAFVKGSVTYTATIVPVPPGAGVPTGTVQFKDGNVNLGGPVALVGGKASVTENNLTLGTHVITAIYSGDGNFLASTGTFNQLVGFQFKDDSNGNVLFVTVPANGISGNGTYTWISGTTVIVSNVPALIEFNQNVVRIRTNTPSLNAVFDATIQSGQAILFDTTRNQSFIINSTHFVISSVFTSGGQQVVASADSEDGILRSRGSNELSGKGGF